MVGGGHSWEEKTEGHHEVVEKDGQEHMDRLEEEDKGIHIPPQVTIQTMHLLQTLAMILNLTIAIMTVTTKWVTLRKGTSHRNA